MLPLVAGAFVAIVGIFLLIGRRRVYQNLPPRARRRSLMYAGVSMTRVVVTFAVIVAVGVFGLIFGLVQLSR